MNIDSQKQTSYPNRFSSYVKSHWASLALFLAGYGVLYLSSAVLSIRTTADSARDFAGYPPSSINPVLPHSFIDPIFLVTSLPTLLIGAAMLCVYSICGISLEAPADKQYVAMLLTAFGFTYLVIGAWPLGNSTEFPWEWQKQVVSFGPAFAWTLELLSWIVLLIGGISLYKHSVIYHQQHPREDTENG